MVAFALLATFALMRLGYLQLLHADDYREQMKHWVDLPPEYVQPLRGDILDRNGRNGTVLAQDAPCWQVEAFYFVLDGPLTRDGRSHYISRLASKRRRAGLLPAGTTQQQAEELVHQAVVAARQRLSELAHVPVWDILAAEQQVVQRIRAIRDRQATRLKLDEDPLREPLVDEERQFHPILKDISSDVANLIRQELPETQYPWLRVSISSKRQYADHPSIAPLLGRMVQVSSEDIQNDPNEDDDLLKRKPGESIGSGGVEYMAEGLLRGRRGKIIRQRDSTPVVSVEPVRGKDVRLTIDTDLQKWIYHRLGTAVQANPMACGAAAVVLDVNSREVLAAVSWPGYIHEELADPDSAKRLAKDTVHTPLLLRAVRGQYPPGSIVKPVAGLAALNYGLTTPQEQINCQGYLFPNDREHWRCWTVSRHAPAHGPLNYVGALQHSCNTYFYTMGQRLGIERLGHWLAMFGAGQLTGCGLPEERRGNLPTAESLAAMFGRTLDKDELQGSARRYGIGQGELELTPMQAANLGATIAAGVWRPVTMLRDQPAPAGRPIQGSSEYLREARQGMYLVVNSPDGTAHNYVYSKVKIAGKTGTAETGPKQYAFGYDVKMHDGSTVTMEFASKNDAKEEFTRLGESVVEFKHTYTKYWPAPPSSESKPTHAWFMGFAPADEPKIAVAVILEYGGGGGKVAGPVARDIFEHYFGIESEHKSDVDVPTE